MDFPITLLKLAGSVALLLWASTWCRAECSVSSVRSSGVF